MQSPPIPAKVDSVTVIPCPVTPGTFSGNKVQPFPIATVSGTVVEPVAAHPAIPQAVVHGTIVRQPHQGVTVTVVAPTESGATSLFPYPNKKEWHSSLCERCFNCESYCWMAWFCSCVSVGQFAAKMNQAGYRTINFNTTIIVYMILFVLDGFLAIYGVDINPHYIFLAVVLAQLRGLARKHLRIPGNGCEDGICSIFCMPCTITQMTTTLWARPSQVPGCDFTANPGALP